MRYVSVILSIIFIIVSCLDGRNIDSDFRGVVSGEDGSRDGEVQHSLPSELEASVYLSKNTAKFLSLFVTVAYLSQSLYVDKLTDSIFSQDSDSVIGKRTCKNDDCSAFKIDMFSSYKISFELTKTVIKGKFGIGDAPTLWDEGHMYKYEIILGEKSKSGLFFYSKDKGDYVDTIIRTLSLKNSVDDLTFLEIRLPLEKHGESIYYFRRLLTFDSDLKYYWAKYYNINKREEGVYYIMVEKDE